MATTAQTVNTTDTLETFRLEFNNIHSDVVTLDNTVSGGGTTIASDNITAGDAAVTIETTLGNITIDAAAGDADIIFKGTDGSSDITALTLDMSDAGKAIFNGAITASTIVLSADGGVVVPDDGNVGSASATTAMQIASDGIVTFVDDILIKDAGTIGNASVAAVLTLAATGIVSFADDIIIKDAGTIGSVSAPTAIGISSAGAISFLDAVDLLDGKKVILGTNSDISLAYDEATTDSLVVSSDVDDAALGIVFQADAGADAGDEWKMNFANGGIFTFGNDLPGAGTHTALMTITPNATAAAATHELVGTLSSSVSIHSLQVSGDSINVPITLDGTDGSSTDAGDNLVQEAGNDENDRFLYEDALFDSIATVASHGITFPGQRIQVSGGASADIVALQDGILIESDFGSGTNFSITLAGNRTLQNPKGLVAGQSGSIFVTQDGTGSQTLAFGSFFHFAAATAPTLTTTANAIDRIDYIVKSTSVIQAVATLAIAAPS
tara:strand:+ start:2250 stop:3740 length:1491 start_codon:yes stop_codon:yes gene_type:complete